MRKQRQQGAHSTIALRLWTHAEAVKGLPYLRSIVGSLREHWLESRRAWRQVELIDARPGRPDRDALISRSEAEREVVLAEESLEETQNELMSLHIHCLDPAKGLAAIPFGQGDELAWFIFDLFAPQGLEAWRFHADPLETRRPLVEELDRRIVDRVFSSPSFDVSMSRGRGKGHTSRGN